MTGILPHDLLEINNNILEWTRYPVVGYDRCQDCNRIAQLYQLGKSVRCRPCGSIMTRLSDKESAGYLGSNPMQGHVIIHDQDGTIIFSSGTNIPIAAHGLECDYRMIGETEIIRPNGKTEVHESPYLAAALRYVLEERDRKKPYIFLIMQSKRPTVLQSLFTNIDEDYLIISGTPNGRVTTRSRTVDLKQVREILDQGIEKDFVGFSPESIQMAKLVSKRAKAWIW